MRNGLLTYNSFYCFYFVTHCMYLLFIYLIMNILFHIFILEGRKGDEEGYEIGEL